ncbi:hypothetical protein CHELA20_52794 [Hyphomicrobiales bacterium]|nr:hypothetical protein CHELA41_22131 [Hyphomicrobiales bacterium]CAH1682940.1 hypothetical protein CHELA20_52794 [Hyphomicrobiales bacterium]
MEPEPVKPVPVTLQYPAAMEEGYQRIVVSLANLRGYLFSRFPPTPKWTAHASHLHRPRRP